MLLKPESASESPGGLSVHPWPTPRFLIQQDLEDVLRTRISNKSPGAGAASGPGTTLENHRLEGWICSRICQSSRGLQEAHSLKERVGVVTGAG